MRRSTRRSDRRRRVDGTEASDVRRGMLVVAMVALLAGGCDLVTAPAVSGGPGCRKLVRQDAADYLNFVKLNGITYSADRPVVGQTLGDGDLGPVHDGTRWIPRGRNPRTATPPTWRLEVRCTRCVATGRPSGWPPARMAGWCCSRLTPIRGRGPVGICWTWRARSAGSASTAATTARPSSGRSPTPGRWPPWFGCCLQELWTSACGPAGGRPARLLAFHLLDGTATVRIYDPGDRRVQPGILVPRRFGELVGAVGS
jgi:hypothetical protein